MSDLKSTYRKLGLEVPTNHDPEKILEGLFEALENVSNQTGGGKKSKKLVPRNDLEDEWVQIKLGRPHIYHSKEIMDIVNRSEKIPSYIQQWALDIVRQQRSLPTLIEEILVLEGLLDKPYNISDAYVKDE